MIAGDSPREIAGERGQGNGDTTGGEADEAAPPSGHGTRRAQAPEARTAADGMRSKQGLLTPVVQIGGLVSTAVAVIGLVFVFAPSLKPDPPAAVKRASIGVLDVQRPVTYRQYLQRTGLAGGDYDSSYLARPGIFVEFDVSIEGLKGVDLPLRWSLHSAGGGQVSESKSTTLRAEAPSDRATWHVWAPLPQRRGSFLLLIQLFDADGVVPLDRAQTEPFPGAP